MCFRFISLQVGSLGTVQLSGLMMGSMFFNVTGLSM